MHELSIAQNIIEITRKNIPANSEQDVRAIRLKIGHAAGIITDSLEFSFNALIQNTTLKDSQLQIERIPLTLQCHACGTTGAKEELLFFCASCGSNHVKIISGLEMEVVDIELQPK